MDDASEEQISKTGVYDRILPPRIEDAGLEDCALPPDSITEAFFKAASAVKSRASAFVYSDDDDDGDCDCDCVERKLKVAEFGLEDEGKGCVVDVLEGLEIAEDAKSKAGEEEKPVIPQGSAA